MQWLSLLISFLVGKFNNSHRPSLKESVYSIVEEAVLKSRKPVALLLGGLASVLILCGGIFISILDLTRQYDQAGFVQFTATLGAGLALVVLTLGAFAWIFMSAWPGAKERAAEKRLQEEQAPREASTLEQALATLVLDFVKEREQKRDQTLHPVPPTPVEKESPSLYN